MSFAPPGGDHRPAALRLLNRPRPTTPPQRLPFIANSDFHKPKHIYSWKTLIHAAKDAEAITDCIRRNEHVAITLYRDFAPAAINTQPPVAPKSDEGGSAFNHLIQDRLPLHAING